MDIAIPLLVIGSLLAAGFIGMVWPGVMYELDTENDAAKNPPKPENLRTVRIQSLVMFLVGCIVLYAFLTAKGPAEGPLF